MDLSQAPAVRPGTPARRTWRRLSRHGAGLLGVAICLVVLAAAVFAPWVAPHDPTLAEMPRRLKPPLTAGHLFGTDQLGRDVLSRVIYGSRVSLAIGLVTVGLAGIIGTALGVASGYYGKWLDTVLMRIVDVQLSFPFILLALTLNAILGLGLKNIIITLVISSWVVYARLARGEVLALKERDFVQAARALGSHDLRIMFRHLLPNLATPVIVVSSLQIAQLIVAEAAISFLGFGVQPPTVSWGSMLAEGRDHLMNAWWLATFPGVALAVAALGVNLTGDWLRDTFDPRLNV